LNNKPGSQRFPAIWSMWTAAFYGIITRLTALLLSIFSQLSVHGLENVPRTGGLIVASNHLNLADPPLLGTVLPRRLRFMAKRELFGPGIGGFCVRSFGAFPVNRLEPDRRALRIAKDLLAGGGAVGMFPEGHRNGGKGLLQAHAGTAFLALLSGAPILPVGITGTERINSVLAPLRRPRITVTVGQPLRLAHQGRIRTEEVESATAEIMAAIAALLPATYRGVYTQSSAK